MQILLQCCSRIRQALFSRPSSKIAFLLIAFIRIIWVLSCGAGLRLPCWVGLETAGCVCEAERLQQLRAGADHLISLQHSELLVPLRCPCSRGSAAGYLRGKNLMKPLQELVVTCDILVESTGIGDS